MPGPPVSIAVAVITFHYDLLRFTIFDAATGVVKGKIQRMEREHAYPRISACSSSAQAGGRDRRDQIPAISDIVQDAG
jgi:hypothetical protein